MPVVGCQIVGSSSLRHLRRWDPDPSTLQVAQTKTQVKAGVDMHTLPGVVRGQARACREPHLQAATTVMGYAVETEDGEIGHVEDLLVDDTAWVIRYLRVDTKNKWADKRVLVAPEWLTGVTWDDSKRFFCIGGTLLFVSAMLSFLNLAPASRHAASDTDA